MVVTIKIGRRVPRNFFKRAAYKTAGLFTFQENLWLMISRALQMSKNKCDSMPEEQVRITIQNKEEDDGLHYRFEWKIVSVSSIFPEKEKEEYDAFMNLYERIGTIKKIVNQKIETNPEISAEIKKSKYITEAQWKEAKAAGYGALKNKDIASKLLEIGIVTHIEWKPDKDNQKMAEER